MFYKKAVFAIFTGKHLCWGLFLVKEMGFLRTTILKNMCERLLLWYGTARDKKEVLLKLFRNLQEKIFSRSAVMDLD